MFRRSIRVTLVCMVILSGASIGFAQSEKEGFALIKEGNQLLNKASLYRRSRNGAQEVPGSPTCL